LAKYHAQRLSSRNPAALRNAAAPPGPIEPAPVPIEPARPAGNPVREMGLQPAYERPVQWHFYRGAAPEPEVLSNPIYQLWSDIEGGFKWNHYFQVYEEVFAPLRLNPMRVLEIGVFNGGGLRLWRTYFSHPETLIVGIDIDPTCRRLDAPDQGIRVKIGSQADPAFLKQVADEFGPFDLILDDGSHLSSHIMITFNQLFGTALKERGIYLVEDLHAHYWPGWRDTTNSFLDFCKELVEHMHAHYSRADPGEFLAPVPSEKPLEVPLITTMIKSIRFFDSIVAIYKTRREFVPNARRNRP